jgi:hypothetical protein
MSSSSASYGASCPPSACDTPYYPQDATTDAGADVAVEAGVDAMPEATPEASPEDAGADVETEAGPDGNESDAMPSDAGEGG